MLIRRFLVTACLLYAVPAAAQSLDSAAEYYEDASRLAARGDNDAAIIQLKNALKLEADHVPSLVLAADTYMSMGRPDQAELMYSDALLAGADRTHISLRLARAYMLQREYALLISNLPLDDTPPSIRADMYGYHAHALLGLGRSDRARMAMQESLALDDDNLEGLLAELSLSLHDMPPEHGLKLAQRLTKDFPQEARAWNGLGLALHRSGDLEGALAAYTRAVALDEDGMDALTARIGLLISMERYDEADTMLKPLEVSESIDPRIPYFRSLVAAHQGDSQAERDALLTVANILARLPEDTVYNAPEYLMAGGITHFRLGELEQAMEYLQRYVARNHDDPNSRMLLATVQLELGKERQTIQTLSPLLHRYHGDPRLMSLIAAAYARTGDPGRAAAIMERVDGAGEGKLASDVDLARYLLEAGARSRGIDLLYAIRAEQDTEEASYHLAQALLASNRIDEAGPVLLTLIQAQPENPDYLNLQAALLTAQGNPEQALGLLDRLISANPDYLPARLNRIRAYHKAGETEAARKLIIETRELAPEDYRFALEMAVIERDNGLMEEARRNGEIAVALDPSALDAQRLLVGVLLELQEYQAAEDQARQAVAEQPRLLDAQALLGQTLLAMGDRREALVTYSRMAKQTGYSAEALHKIAQLQIEAEDYPGARNTLFKAIETNPDYLPTQADHVRALLLMEDYDQAEQFARKLTEAFPETATGHLLWAQAAMANGNFREAEQQFERAGEFRDLQLEAALGASRAQQALGRTVDAEQTLRGYIAARGPHLRAQAALGTLLIREERWADARVVMEQLLAVRPDFPAFLNNQAVVLQNLGEPEALEFARRAHAAAPDSPAINDTLGWILVQAGQADDAITYLREAKARAANSAEISYHLGEALYQLERRTEAAIELRHALTLTGDFRGRQRAEALLAELDQQAL